MTHKTQSIKGFVYAYGLISHICKLAIDIQKWYFKYLLFEEFDNKM